MHSTYRYVVVCVWLSIISSSAIAQSPAKDVLTDLYREGCNAQSEDYIQFYSQARQSFGPYGVEYPDDGELTVTKRWEPSERAVETLYFNELYQNREQLSQEYFIWCIKLFSTKYDIFGCIDVNGTFNVTSEMATLGLMDLFTLPADSPAVLQMNRERSSVYSLLHNALIIAVADLPFLNYTVAKYHNLLILDSPGMSISFPTLDEFLTQNETKTISCNIIGPNAGIFIRWEHNGVAVTRCQPYEGSCDHRVYYFVTETSHEELRDCRYFNDFNTAYVKSELRLIINSVVAEDIGNYTCLAETQMPPEPPSVIEAKTLLVNIAFHNQSNPSITLSEHEDASVVCKVTAPSDASVRWRKGSVSVDPLSGLDRGDSCSKETSLRTHSVLSSEQQGSNFSVFTLELVICSADHFDAGVYSCVVELADETAEINFNILVDPAVGVNPPINSVNVALTVVFPVCVIALVILIVLVTLWILHNKRIERIRRKSSVKIPFLKKSGSIKNGSIVESPISVAWCSFIPTPKAVLEFPRSQLQLESELGRGRFGKVWKAQALRIIPSEPDRNVVAVKTVVNSTSQTEMEQLCSEIEIMSRINPHSNICNLLAYCTSAIEPPCLIMEYACHGNLKDFLRKCRNNIVNSGGALKITQDTSPSQSSGDAHHTYYNDPQRQEEKLNQNVLAVVNPYDHLNARTSNPASNELADDGIRGGDTNEYDRLDAKGEEEYVDTISEGLVCSFARQISAGLSHLETEGIVHRDLAARNVLIVEGFLLKISDFGMARQFTPEDNKASLDGEYQRLATPEIIPAKWTAPEILEQKKYSYQSDVWSYGIVIWEIASYGSDPYSDFNIGVSMNPFIQHLKSGSHPPKPEGLSENIYEVMCRCWQVDPKRRPSAAMVGFMINQAEQSLSLHGALEGIGKGSTV